MESFGAGRFREAEDRFSQAYALRADPALLYNLGRAAHKAGRPQDAVPYYQRFLAADAAGDAEQRRKAEQYLAQARREAAPPSLAPPQPKSETAPGPPASERQPVQTQPSTEKPRVPVYRNPWLWVIVGVAVAGAAVGLGVGLAARRPDLSGAMVARPFEN
jgi:tetratricopeptide (TPR) repeat protein